MMLAEHTGKIVGVGKSDLLTDPMNGKNILCKQIGSLVHPNLHQVLQGCNPQRLFKKSIDVLWRITCPRCDVLKRDRFRV